MISSLVLPVSAVSGMLMAMAALIPPADAQERQLTSTARNHWLDNNDNYSHDDRYLCFDTRATLLAGNGNSPSIMKVDVRTGEEKIVYEPSPAIHDPVNAAPGVIAASYNPVADQIVFIHGPLASETPKIGFYGLTNRRGAVAPADGSGQVRFLDYRDVSSSATPPGAHRGGTHRHEYSPDGSRVGFTYNDHPLPEYGRTIGMLVPSAKAPGGATHWFVLLVPVVPEKQARTGDLVLAASDSWIGTAGTMRSFVGRVKEEDGTFRDSLFVVDIPADIDVTTAFAGTQTEFPKPPRGITIRRLTHTSAKGIVRGSRDGSRIAYLAKAADGTTQVFTIDSHGSDRDPVPEKRPIQVTQLPGGVAGSVRWHPSGNALAVIADHGVAVVSLKPGTSFGKSSFVSRHGAGLPQVEGIVWSNSGSQIAFNRRVPMPDGAKDSGGLPFQQIFLVDYHEGKSGGTADSHR